MKVFVCVVAAVGALASMTALIALIVSSLAANDLHVVQTLLVVILIVFFGTVAANWPVMEIK